MNSDFAPLCQHLRDSLTPAQIDTLYNVCLERLTDNYLGRQFIAKLFAKAFVYKDSGADFRDFVEVASATNPHLCSYAVILIVISTALNPDEFDPWKSFYDNLPSLEDVMAVVERLTYDPVDFGDWSADFN